MKGHLPSASAASCHSAVAVTVTMAGISMRVRGGGPDAAGRTATEGMDGAAVNNPLLAQDEASTGTWGRVKG